MRQVTVVGPEGRTILRGKIVVEDGVRIWETKVRESRHLFRALDAWTLSETILRQLQDLEVERIRLIVADRDGEIYEVSVADFLKQAELLDQSTWSNRTEEQYALPRKHWELKRGSTHRPLQLALAF